MSAAHVLPRQSDLLRPKTIGRPYVHRRVRDPERDAEHQAFVIWFQAWLARHHISLRDLSSLVRVEYATAQKKHSGESPFSCVDVRHLPKRCRHEFLIAFLAYCDERDARENPIP